MKTLSRFLKLAVAVLPLSICLPSNAQTDPTNANLLKDFTIYSPDAYSFSKVDNIKANLCTGQITPQVPIFQKKMSVLSLNVYLSFLGGGGLKADDPGSVAGRGWQINWGGMIVRTIRGVPDDFHNINPQFGTGLVLPVNNGVMFNNGVATYADGMQIVNTDDASLNYYDGFADSQHDIYEFNFPGRSGKFYIGKDHTILVADDSKLQIIPQLTTTYEGGEISGFTIIDESGIKYIFNAAELSSNGHFAPLASGSPAEGTYYSFPYVSGWYLSEIDAPSGEENIKFTYTGRQVFNDLTSLFTYTRSTKSFDPFGFRTSIVNGSYSDVTTNGLKISSILFSDSSKVNFNYFPTVAAIQGELQSVEVFNSQQQRIRNYLFNYLLYDYYSTGPDPVKTIVNYDDSVVQFINNPVAAPNQAHLESIDLRDSSNNLLPYYTFGYYLDDVHNETVLGNQHSVDFWGYFNGVNNSANPLNVTVPGYGGPANFQPNLAFAQIGALQSITYPTGGSETFEYELNDRLDIPSQTNVTVGGIRVKRRILHDRVDPLHDIVKEYQYLDNSGRSSGFLGTPPIFTTLARDYDQWPSQTHSDFADTTTVNMQINPLSSIEGSDAGYARVVETTRNGSGNNGQTVYTYTDLGYAPLWTIPDNYPYSPVEEPTWAVGLPLSVLQYDVSGNLLKSTFNNYQITQSYFTGENYRSLYVAKYGTTDIPLNDNQIGWIFKYKNYYPLLGRTDLVSTTTTTNGTGSLPMVTDYQETDYDPTYHFIRKSVRTNSKGESITNRYYYPFDYSLGQGSVTTKMVQENMLNKPISVESWKNDQSLLDCQLTQYADLGGGLIRPATTWRAALTAALPLSVSFDPTTLLNPNYNMQKDITYNRYDASGRLLTQSARGDEVESIVMDRSGVIIARAVNAGYNQVAYTSFESNELPGWTYNNSGISLADKKTGLCSYNGIVSNTSFPVGDYRLGLWAKGSGSVTVNGVNTAISASWTFYSWKLTGIGGITINSNGNLIDEITAYPVNATLLTYTYKGDVGMTSESDNNGKIQLYTYDAFNRLKSVIDQSGNYVKSFSYTVPAFYNAQLSTPYNNYLCIPNTDDSIMTSAPAFYVVPARQYVSAISQADADGKAQENNLAYGVWYTRQHHPACEAIWYNQGKSQVFGKQCAVGSFGPSFTYTVPPRKYSSLISQQDANDQQQADINANGQNAANAVGVCTPYVTISSLNEPAVPGFFAVFINNADGSSWQFAIPTDANVTLGQIPQGTYEVRITNLQGNTTPYNIIVGCANGVNGTSADLMNVTINAECSDISID